MFITIVFLGFSYVSTVFGYSGFQSSPVLDGIRNPKVNPCIRYYPYPQCTVHPQCNQHSGSMFYLAPSVAIFTNTLFETIFNSAILSDLCDLSQTTTAQYSQYVYEYNIDLYKSTLSYKNAVAIAEFASRAIGWYFDVLTPPVVARTVCSTAADYLLFEGILNTDNSENLALAYAETMEIHAKVNMTADPTSKFKVLADSFFEYMFAVDEKAKDTSPIATYCYGLEWFASAVLYRCIDQ